MKPSVDLAEFRSAYLAEVDDHLTAAGAHLLAIEGALKRGEPVARPVRELFRLLHTIKGLSAMVGVEPVVAIAHLMEAALLSAERAGGRLAPASVDALLQGVRAIELRVRALEADAQIPEPPPDLLAALEAIEAPDAPPSPHVAANLTLDPEVEGKLTAAEKELLLAGLRAGKRAARVDFAPSPARAEQGLTINAVRERVRAVAEIVRVLPLARPRGDESPSGLVFALLLSTSAPDDALAAAAGVRVADVTSLASPAPHAAPDPPRAPASAAEPAAPPGRPDPEWAPEQDDMPRRGVLRVEVDRVDEAMERLSALVVTRYKLEACAAALPRSRELEQILAEHARQLRDLRAAILRVRMVPVAEVLERVPLIVRGLRRTTGKPVRVEIEGAGAELDKAVAERIFPAIVHLVRNAVDHAIEPPEERERLGKPREGLVRITCAARGNTVLELSISDDGRGIDRGAIARRAGAADAAPGDAALLEMLCAPGFSTRAEATTTSGRGMGLDIVRRTVVGELGGELLLRTEPGAGTTFTVRVPLTISIIDAFTFECASQRFVVPIAMVEEIVEVDPGSLRAGPGSVALFERRGEAVPLLLLDGVLRGDRRAGVAAGGKALVVRRAGEPVAFAVDRLLGQREAVVRPLEDPLVRVPGVSGATDLGDGRPTLVLDLVALSAALAGGAPRADRRFPLP